MASMDETSYQPDPNMEDDFMAAMPGGESEEEDLIIEELLAEEFAIIRS